MKYLHTMVRVTDLTVFGVLLHPFGAGKYGALRY